MEAHPYKISSILNPNQNNVLYTIPKYQRVYTWNKKQWDTLFNDIVENDPGYFLGSIICVNTKRNVLETTTDEIIDGQQRITSLSILLLCLYEKINNIYDELDDEEKADLINIKRELVTTSADDKKISLPRLTPQVGEFNKDDYFSLLFDNGLLREAEKRPKAGKRKLYKAYKQFSNNIDDYIEDRRNNSEDFSLKKELFSLEKKFNAANLVVIQVETNKEAYMLFESLNDRGVPLSAIDLLKNILIRVSDDEDKASDDTYATWNRILSYLGDEDNARERFFRYYYDTYREEINKPYKVTGRQKYYFGTVATKSTILDIYEKLIEDNYKDFLSNIEKEARTYSILINNAKEEDIINVLAQPLLNLERIQGAPAYILLMYLISNKDKCEIDDNKIQQIVNYIISFFVRRNITDFPNTRNLVKIFMDTVDIAKHNKGDDLYKKITEYLKNNSSSDEEFEKKLNGPLYLDNPDATRFILCHYEDTYKTKEHYTDLWSRDEKDKYIWTIEHIFPEGDNIPNHWIDMIANGDRELAYKYLDEYVHTLGNLTITGYNSNLGNKSFEEKKNRKKDGKEIGYKNGLKLNEDVVNQEKWTIDNIANRTNKFVKYILEQFKL